MIRILFILIFIPSIILCQTRDYKSYDKAVKYFNKGKNEKAKEIIIDIIKENSTWQKPYFLISKILSSEGDINSAANYLLEIYDKHNVEDIEGIEKVVDLYYSNGYYAKSLEYLKVINRLDSTFQKKKLIKYTDNCLFALESINNPQDFKPKYLGSEINTYMSEYLPALSIDGNKLVFTRRVEVDNQAPQEDFYISNIDSGKWSNAIPFSDLINTAGNEGALSFSPDFQMIVYTACNRPAGEGRCDLYFMLNNKNYNAGKIINSKYWESQGVFSPDAKYLYFVSNRPGGYGGKDIWKSEFKEGNFLEPVNLGPNINTEYDEMSPFIHPDNLTFYFSSEGHTGMGGFDLFLSRRNSIEDSWGEVENLGFPINTYRTENSLIVSYDGKTAYYVSDVESINSFGKEDILQFTLPNKKRANYISKLERDIISNKKGEEIILRNVLFASNSLELDSASIEELNKLISYLLKNPNLVIEIQGHTDDIGSKQDNQILSEKRAEVIFEYLRKRVQNKLIYRGFGEEKPLQPNKDEESRRINRRTSFIIIY